MSRLSKSIFFSSVLFVLLFLSALSGNFVHAQTIPGISDPVTFSMIPEYPQPNEIITIKAQSYSTDLDKAVFRWTVNGKTYAEGAGLKSINVKTGPTGSIMTVSAEVSTSDFGLIRNDISFRPVEISLLWQSDTYVPPFYKGKALHSYNGAFKVTAIPEFFDLTGKRIDPKDLIYTWKKNGTVQGDASGLGKDSFVTTQTSYLREGEDIAVDVSSPKDILAGSASITVNPTFPEINFYENSPLYGVVYEKALKRNLNLSQEEITLRAEPFYMSTKTPLNGLLTFDWKMNDASVADFKNKNEITLRKSGTNGGQSYISLVVQNQAKVLQGASGNITILQ